MQTLKTSIIGLLLAMKKAYEGFLKELEERYLRKETKEKICKIKLFKFSDGEFYSFNEIVKRQIIQNRVTSTSLWHIQMCFSKLHKKKK
jgi:hypothetical protein